MTKVGLLFFRHLDFVILSSFGIRHWSFCGTATQRQGQSGRYGEGAPERIAIA